MNRADLLAKIAAELNQDPDLHDVYPQGDVVVVEVDGRCFEVEVHDA